MGWFSWFGDDSDSSDEYQDYIADSSINDIDVLTDVLSDHEDRIHDLEEADN